MALTELQKSANSLHSLEQMLGRFAFVHFPARREETQRIPNLEWSNPSSIAPCFTSPFCQSADVWPSTRAAPAKAEWNSEESLFRNQIREACRRTYAIHWGAQTGGVVLVRRSSASAGKK